MDRFTHLTETNLRPLCDLRDVLDSQRGAVLRLELDFFDVGDILDQADGTHVDLLRAFLDETSAGIGVCFSDMLLDLGKAKLPDFVYLEGIEQGERQRFAFRNAVAERILIQPGGLIWKDRSVRMFLHLEYPHGRYWFSSARWEAKSIWLTLEGPGRVAVQSVFERPELGGSVRNTSGATTQYW